MKKKGFISISIIYSFFIVFLLLLVLTLSTYITNRYSFGIYTKDEKKYHAARVPLVVNSEKVVRIKPMENYYSSYYVSQSIIKTGETETKTVIDSVPYYFLTTNGVNPTDDSVTNEVEHIVIYLGDSKDYRLSYNHFFSKEIEEIPVMDNIPDVAPYLFQYIPKKLTTLSKSIVIVPALNTRYSNWEQYVTVNANELIYDSGSVTDTTLINSLIKNVQEAYGINITIKSNCKISFVGFAQGANGVLRLAGRDASAADPYEYYAVQSSISCGEEHCDSYIQSNLKPKKAKIHGYCRTVPGSTDYCALMNKTFTYGMENAGNVTTYTNTNDKLQVREAVKSALNR